MNMADYKKKGIIRYFLNSYGKLRFWASRGDTVAHSIVMDLDACLNHDDLTDKMRSTLIRFYIREYNKTEIAQEDNVTPKAIEFRINAGIGKIHKLLNEGDLYNE